VNTPTSQLRTPTVLVVEDDDSVRHLMVRDLEQAGYRVLAAADGVEAWMILEQPRAVIDLVIADFMMPRLDGHELAVRLGSISNAPEIMLISEYRLESELDGEIVTKPFRTADLTAAVRRIFAARSEAEARLPS
jgi:two-component system, OmpR family, response regulator